jgi:hypothetical protein
MAAGTTLYAAESQTLTNNEALIGAVLDMAKSAQAPMKLPFSVSARLLEPRDLEFDSLPATNVVVMPTPPEIRANHEFTLGLRPGPGTRIRAVVVVLEQSEIPTRRTTLSYRFTQPKPKPEDPPVVKLTKNVGVTVGSTQKFMRLEAPGPAIVFDVPFPRRKF